MVSCGATITIKSSTEKGHNHHADILLLRSLVRYAKSGITCGYETSVTVSFYMSVGLAFRKSSSEMSYFRCHSSVHGE